ncbi:division plane positioning ATPase MipZ [Methylobacterium sp. CM6247]
MALQVLTLAAQKGGSGKSTLASSIAVAAAQEGQGVVLIDMDPQKSLREWHRRRQTGQHEVMIHYRPIEDEADPKRELTPEEADTRLTRLLAAVRTHAPTTLAIIDTPGSRNLIADIGVDPADFVLVPVRPGILDFDPVKDTALDLVVAGKSYAFVLNQVQAVRAASVQDAIDELTPIGTISPEMIGMRADFDHAMVAGEGVTEYRPRSQGAAEVRALWTWIKNRMERQLA